MYSYRMYKRVPVQLYKVQQLRAAARSQWPEFCWDFQSPIYSSVPARDLARTENPYHVRVGAVQLYEYR